MQVSIEDLKKIEFIDHANLDGRVIPSLMFYADKQWHAWLITQKGLMKFKGQPAEGCYFGQEPERKDDVFFNFLHFIGQHSSFSEVMRPFIAIQEDFFNICASIKKFDILFEVSPSLNGMTARLVMTELEYLFSLCRSIFDLLQEAIAAQWETVRLNDTSIKKKKLPRSFAGIVLNGEILRTEAELVERFKILPPLAAFYFRNGPFFQVLRTYRDRYVHGGTTPEYVFVTERGFAVWRNTLPFAGFNVWNESHMLQNKLCSLRPVIGHLILETLRTCEDYAATIQKVIRFPPAIAPGMGLYVRGHFNSSLAEIREATEKCLWWKEA